MHAISETDENQDDEEDLEASLSLAKKSKLSLKTVKRKLSDNALVSSKDNFNLFADNTDYEEN